MNIGNGARVGNVGGTGNSLGDIKGQNVAINGNTGPKRVRFAEQPQIFQVESYKAYNRDVSNGVGCCVGCNLI